MTQVAEVDGNRTRRTGITHPTRFEGGGAHQALGHLRRATYPPRTPMGREQNVTGSGYVAPMSKNRIILVVVLLALLAILFKKVKDV